jgi:hypothetical protein
VLAGLVAVGDEDGSVGLERPEPREHVAEKTIARGWTVEGSRRHDRRLEPAASPHPLEDPRSWDAKEESTLSAPNRPRARKRERVEQGDVEAAAAQGRRELNRPEIGKVRVIHEVRPDRQRRVDDEDTHATLQSGGRAAR